jgi:metal-responsive CopG/Arc/MetJ family transcriptional regulator
MKSLETAKAGFANGISTFLNNKQLDGDFTSLTEDYKKEIISKAELHYGNFLTALVLIGKMIQILLKPHIE